jgi:hypothetical protein
MTIDKANMDWYLEEHGRISTAALDGYRGNPRLHGLLIDREPWEEWLRDANKEAWGTYQRLRTRANELWVQGSEDETLRRQFTLSVETEYQLAVWAAMQFLEWQEKAKALKALGPMEGVSHAGNTRYE